MNYRMLTLAGLLALLLAFFAAFLIVVSQNPSAGASGPKFEYGSPSPGPR